MKYRVSPRLAYKPAVIALGVIGAAMFVGISAALLLAPSPPAAHQPFEEIPQTAVASSHGVTIRALGASFSGTETILRLKVAVTDPGAVSAALGQGVDSSPLAPSGRGYSGPFPPAPLTATLNRAGEVVVVMPALAVGDNYTGTLALHFTSIQSLTGSNDNTLDGDWPLSIVGPDPATIAEQLRIDQFSASTIRLGTDQISISGLRSHSETRVSISLDSGLRMLSAPALISGGTRTAAASVDLSGSVVTASFPSTPFGSDVQLELGTIATSSSGGPSPIIVRLSEVLSRAGNSTRFPIVASDVISGDAQLVLKGEQGTYGQRRWVGFQVSGDWHPTSSSPKIVDGRGQELALAHVQVGYQKDASGTILEGTTNIAAFVDADSDLSRVTMLLGDRSIVDHGVYKVTLNVK